MKKSKPSVNLVRELLSYDQESGEFKWIKKPSDKIMVGQKAGHLATHGYISITIGKVHIYAHHIAWALMTGEWPKQIDHKDGNRANNSWNNLRKATTQQNAANKRKYPTASLPKGVKKSRKVYCAQIMFDGENIYLGTYKTPELAHEAYVQASKKYFGEFARTE